MCNISLLKKEKLMVLNGDWFLTRLQNILKVIYKPKEEWGLSREGIVLFNVFALHDYKYMRIRHRIDKA